MLKIDIGGQSIKKIDNSTFILSHEQMQFTETFCEIKFSIVFVVQTHLTSLRLVDLLADITAIRYQMNLGLIRNAES